MSPENRERLEKYRFVLSERSFTPGNGLSFEEVLGIIWAEFNPNYTVNMYCDHCKMEMFKYAFNQMDNQK